ncbi:hypothetical protein VTH82DRAFT_5969, partial [Thermothelomyces myriococcoides]
METIRSMLGCVALRRARHQEYSDLVGEKMAPLYSDDVGVAPYPPHEVMSYYHPHGGVTTPTTSSHDYSDEKVRYQQQDTRTTEEVARDVAQLLFQAKWNDDELQERISGTVGNRAWNRKMVEYCLDA